MKLGMGGQVSKAQLIPTLNMKRSAHLCFTKKENYIQSHS